MIENRSKQINDDVNALAHAMRSDDKPPMSEIMRLFGGYLMDVHATRVATAEIVELQRQILRAIVMKD